MNVSRSLACCRSEELTHQGEGTKLFQEVLELIDSRNETLLGRIEKCVNQALIRHLGNGYQHAERPAACSNIPEEKARMPNAKQATNDALLNLSTTASSESQKAADKLEANKGSKYALPNPGDVIVGRVCPPDQKAPDKVETNKGSRQALPGACRTNCNDAGLDKVAVKQGGDVITSGNLNPVFGDGNKSIPQETVDEVLVENQECCEKVAQIDHFEPGNVALEIIEAKGLYGADCSMIGSRTSDPYVSIHLNKRREPRSKGAIFRTHTVKKTVDPVWNAYCKFEVAPDLKEIWLELWDEDLMKEDDLLGRVTIHPSDILSAAGMERWFVIAPQDDCPHAKGQVFLRASFEPDEETVGMNAYWTLQRWHTKQEVDVDDIQGPCFRRLVGSKKFDSMFLVLIIFNAVLMMCELEYNGRKAMAVVGLDEPGSTSSPVLESIFYGLNLFFAAAFLIELIFRLAAFGREYLKKVSNWLDIVIVAGAIMDVLGDILGGSTFMNLTFLRLIRLTKLSRLLKAAMIAKFCEPLRILWNAMSTSFGYLFWSFVFLSFLEIVSALLMTQFLAEYILDENLDLEIRRFIYEFYGTTSRTFLTMFQITMSTGQWALVGRPIVEKVNPAFAVFFVAYVGGVSFAVIRIITALFLRKTLQTAIGDEEFIQKEKVKGKRLASEDMREQWCAVDPTGKVSFAAFQKILKSAEGHDWLHMLDIDYADACGVFDLVSDGYGRLTLDEFLSGVFRMSQPVKQIDMVLLGQDSKKMGKMMDDVQTQLQELHFLCLKLQDVEKRLEDEFQDHEMKSGVCI